MFCIKCGKTLDPSVTVCPDCGTGVVLPEGFDPHKENTVKVDIDMLVGEKTVAADHSAIARKAAAAANANTASEAPTEEPAVIAAPVAPAAPVMQDTVPHSPAGFDLKNVKKTMNGRSILIDDSPLPGTVPAYLAPVPVQAAPSVLPQAQLAAAPAVAEKPQDKKTLILIIAAAILGVALIAALLVFFLGGDKNDKGRDKEDEENAITVAATEKRTEEETKRSDKEDYFGSDNTSVHNIGEEYNTDRYFNGDDDAKNENGNENEKTESSTRRPPSNKPTNPFNSEDRTGIDNSNEPLFNGSFGNNSDEPVSLESGDENNGEKNAEEENNGGEEENGEDEDNKEENGSLIVPIPPING